MTVAEAYPGVRGGLLEGEPRPATLREVAEAGLRGRGGAAFPLARKIEAVRRGEGPRVVVANGAEGEPASLKDRWLMGNRPDLVEAGLRLAAGLVGAEETRLYVPERPAYVAGEETAVVRALNGGPPLPEDKPPRPYEAGVRGRPTLVSNVETLAHLALIRRGATTFLLTLDGAEVLEVPFGTTLREVLVWRGRDPDAVRAVMMGGYFGGLLNARALDLPLDYDVLRREGSGLGCGAVTLVTDPVRTAADVLAYFARENSGQCGSCFNGTAAMSLVARRLADGTATGRDVERLRHWSAFLPGRGACGTLDGAALMARSLLREFP